MISKIKMKIVNFIYRFRCRLLNKNKDFTIISSNCIGSAIYQDLNIQYNTPTIGLFFYAPCYIKFIYNLQYYLNSPLLFQKKSKYFDKNVSYPIGSLGDIEVHFLHYGSEEEAIEKWTKRVKRINYSNMFFIFSDRDQCTYKELNEFDAFKSNNKICFSAKEYLEFNSLVCLREYINCDSVGDLYGNKLYRKYLDIIKWLNNSKKNINENEFR